MQRLVLTIPFTSEGPDELEKLLGLLNNGPACDFEGSPYWAIEPDGTVLLCIPAAIAEMPASESE